MNLKSQGLSNYGRLYWTLVLLPLKSLLNLCNTCLPWVWGLITLYLDYYRNLCSCLVLLIHTNPPDSCLNHEICMLKNCIGLHGLRRKIYIFKGLHSLTLNYVFPIPRTVSQRKLSSPTLLLATLPEEHTLAYSEVKVTCFLRSPTEVCGKQAACMSSLHLCQGIDKIITLLHWNSNLKLVQFSHLININVELQGKIIK